MRSRSQPIVLAATMLAAACGSAIAQIGPQPPAAPAQAPGQASGEAEARLASLAEAYRSAPIRESVTVRVKDDRGRTSQSIITVAIDPGKADAPRRLRLELGQLIVTAVDQRVLASTKNDNSRYAEFTLPNEPLKPALEKLFPALALPQLVLADRTVPATVAGLRDLGLTPSSDQGPAHVLWRGTKLDRASGRQVIEGDIAGASVPGTLKLTIERGSNRLRSAELTLESGPVRAIDVNVRAIELTDPTTWPIDTAARTAVDSLSDLTGSGESLRIGHAVPLVLNFLTTAGTRWVETSDQLASVLVLTRFDTHALRERADLERRDATFRELRRTVLPAIKVRDQLQLGSESRYNARCVALIDDADLTTSQAGLLFRLFDSEDNLSVPNPRTETLLLAESSADLDPVLAGGIASVVIVDQDRIVRGIVTVDDPAVTEKRVREILDRLPPPRPRGERPAEQPAPGKE